MEFSLCLPLLILCIAGIMDFGKALREYSILVEATRIAARNTAGYQGDLTICEVAEKQLSLALASAGVSPANYEIKLQAVDVNDKDSSRVVRHLADSTFPKMKIPESPDDFSYAVKFNVSRKAGSRFGSFISYPVPRSAEAMFYVESKKDIEKTSASYACTSL